MGISTWIIGWISRAAVFIFALGGAIRYFEVKGKKEAKREAEIRDLKKARQLDRALDAAAARRAGDNRAVDDQLRDRGRLRDE